MAARISVSQPPRRPPTWPRRASARSRSSRRSPTPTSSGALDLMSPLVWDLAHIAAYEDLWLVHRHGGRELLHAELAAVYDAFETPRGRARRDRAARPRRRARATSTRCASARSRCSTSAARRRDAARARPAPRAAAHRDDAAGDARSAASPAPGARRARRRPPGGHTGLERRRPRRAVRASAPARDGFAYDNERPRHADVRASASAAPITNATWLASRGRRLRAREWWSDEGWAWKEEYDITHRGWAGRDRRARGTSPGSRPTPSRAPRGRAAARRRRSGRRRRPRPRRARATSALVWEWTSTRVHRLPRLRRAPVPRVLRGLLRLRLPRAARRLVGHARARARRPRSATGTSRSGGRSSPACGSQRTAHDDDRRRRSTPASAPATSARSPRTSSTA